MGHLFRSSIFVKRPNLEREGEALRRACREELAWTRSRWFRYVRHADREQAEADGWIFSADLGAHHRFYSVLMEWPTSIDPPTRVISATIPHEGLREDDGLASAPIS